MKVIQQRHVLREAGVCIALPVLFLALSMYVYAEEPAFPSKLFTKAELVQSDDFVDGHVGGIYQVFYNVDSGPDYSFNNDL
jgi:hypothetical protein